MKWDLYKFLFHVTIKSNNTYEIIRTMPGMNGLLNKC